VMDHLEELVLANGGALPSGSGAGAGAGAGRGQRVLAEPPQDVTKRGEKALFAFAEQLLELRAKAMQLTVPELGLYILQKFVTPQYLLKISKDPVEAAERQENVDELIKAMSKFAGAEGGCLQNGMLGSFLEEAALLSTDDLADAVAGSTEGNVVMLMTIHASKGLEFDVVMLTGLEDGTLPLLRTSDDALGVKPSQDSDEVAEERRLCFVAVTRAKSILFLMTRAQVLRFRPDSKVELSAAKPSRFLKPLAALGKETVANLKWTSPASKK